jgi:DNA polymerase-3 subunit delta
MPPGTFSTVQAAIKAGTPAPVYLIVGDDDRGKDDLVHAFHALIPEDLRPFNLERLSAAEHDAMSIVSAARTIPLLGDRRIVIVSRMERWLTGKPRKGKNGDDDATSDAGAGGEEESGGGASDALYTYLESPDEGTTLVLVASDINRSTRLAKLLVKSAVVVECWGLKNEKELKGGGIAEALERAASFVATEAKKAGMTIDRAALEPLLEHAGTDIATLRGDVERLLLYCHGRKTITLEDVRANVGGATLVNAWGVTNAIERSDAREALRQLRLAFDSGAVPFMVLGQLAWFVRSKLPLVAPNRVRGAVDAVFRTDMSMKTSGGEPQVLLERLIVELCTTERRSSTPVRR